MKPITGLKITEEEITKSCNNPCNKLYITGSPAEGLAVLLIAMVHYITGSPAGLSRINCDDPHSAKMVKFNHLPKSQL